MTVRELRKKLGWSQEKLAREIGVALNSVARWESTGREPELNNQLMLRKVAIANGIDGFAPNCPCCGRPL